MSEEKDDFLREIDELLGDIDEEPISHDTPLANGSAVGKDIDYELKDTLNGLSLQENDKKAAPKTG